MAGMAVFPFILVKETRFKGYRAFMNHEKIHLVQQLELLLIGFYVLYLLHYFYNLLKYSDHNKAYLNIIFEKEAYLMEAQADYIHQRSFCNWVKFL
jgi:hypothetical protein